MTLCQLFEDTAAYQQNKVTDLSASVGVLITEGVEDDTAVDVDITAEWVSLQGITSVDDWRVHILLFLSCLLSKKDLVILEVFQRGFDT